MRGGVWCHWPCPRGPGGLCWASAGGLGDGGAGGCSTPATPPSPAAFPSAFSAPTPVTDIRTDKVEQKSVSLSWQEPGSPNGTEYEVKYYEKVGTGSGGRLGDGSGSRWEGASVHGAVVEVLLAPVGTRSASCGG